MQVYMSYAQQDRELAWNLAKALKNAGLHVWIDIDNIYPGDNWAEVIGKALKESQAMVVLLTPSALQSEWVRKDIAYAIGNLAYEWRVIPVLVGGMSADEIPWILRQMQVIHLENPEQQDRIEQIAEALREASQGLISHGS